MFACYDATSNTVYTTILVHSGSSYGFAPKNRQTIALSKSSRLLLIEKIISVFPSFIYTRFFFSPIVNLVAPSHHCA